MHIDEHLDYAIKCFETDFILTWIALVLSIVIMIVFISLGDIIIPVVCAAGTIAFFFIQRSIKHHLKEMKDVCR